ncbi:MAG: hypothetical protein WAV50_01425 [Minisyncoccia bacterium]
MSYQTASNRHKKSPFMGFLVLPLLAGQGLEDLASIFQKRSEQKIHKMYAEILKERSDY